MAPLVVGAHYPATPDPVSARTPRWALRFSRRSRARYRDPIVSDRSKELAAPPKRLACRVFGCKWRFWAEGADLHRACERCDRSIVKRYESAEQADRYARYLDREPRPPVGLFGILSGTLIRDPDSRRERGS